jgi:RNA polymerase sigma-70 factor (ECF subfamily)
MVEETSLGGENAFFQDTLWTVVLKARDRSAPDWRDALSKLIQMYWKPLYFYVRRRGKSVDEAKDLTQAFFVSLLEYDALQSVDRTKGKFKSFLLAALTHFMANEYDKQRAQKRGGGAAHVSFDYQSAETEYTREPATHQTPELLYQRQWALALIDNALAELKAECAQSGREKQFEVLRAFLTTEPPSYRELAEKLDVKEADVTNYLHRMRKRLQQLLRAKVRDVVSSDDDLRHELAELFKSL